MEAGHALCEQLPWDSAFFGVSIARALPPYLDESSRDAMIEWCRGKRIDCLYFLCPLEDASTQRLLTDAAFQLVGVRVTLSRPPGPDEGASSGRFRPANVDDIPRLREIALTSHRDTRFHGDGHFDPARCDELYATWIENSVRGYATHVLVAEEDIGAVGYITLHLDTHESEQTIARTGRVGLFAVDGRWRGRGLGRALLRSAAQWLQEQHVTETFVITPGRNTGALKLYKSAGFRTTDVSLWYHRWFRDTRR